MSKKKAEPIKEVKEMADLIHSEDETIVVLFYNDSLVLAERLYNAGYRKASDVAREILALVWDAYQTTHYDAEFEERFDNIAKKYESEGEG